MNELKDTQFFKILVDGKSCHGGEFTWSLPVRQEDGTYLPGDWHEYKGTPKLCSSGFHVTSEMSQWIISGETTYKAEIDWNKEVDFHNGGDQISVQRLRLLSPFSGVNSTQMATVYCSEGRVHRDSDLPAMVCANGDKFWYKDGKRHRENDLPAIEYASGNKCWYKDGKRHRENDLPAIVCANGSQYWWENGIWIKSEQILNGA